MRSKKTVPAKNSEAIFWRPRFTRPLRAGKRANANFACSEGFFCARRAAPSAGAAAFSKPAAVWPVGFCARCLGVFSAGAPLPCSRPACLAACRFCADFCACLPAVRLCVQGFFCRCLACWLSYPVPRLFSASAPLPCSRLVGSLLLLCLAWSGLRCRGLLAVCPPCACVCAHFSLIFRLFLPNFFLSKFFSLVAQAATGLYFLPKRK